MTICADINSNVRIFESPAFTFYVGHEKRVFNVHIGAIRHHSRPLEVLMTGPMSEAQNGCAHLPDVDVDTFARFVQFAYMGDYGGHPAQFAPRQKYTHISSQAEQPPKLSARRADDSVHTAVQKGDVSPSNQQSGEGCRESCLLREFRNLTFCHRLPFLFDCRDVGDSTMNTVLRHAETYVFADTYQIERLRNLALAKAHAYLRRTSSMSAIHVVELVKYTLHNTMDSTDSPDELRKVVMMYLACVVDQLIGVKEFLSLLENEPSLSVQLIPVMVKRFGEK